MQSHSRNPWPCLYMMVMHFALDRWFYTRSCRLQLQTQLVSVGFMPRVISGWVSTAYMLVLLLPVLGVVAAQTNNGVGPRQEQVSKVSGNLAPAPSPMDSIGKVLSALIYTYL